MRSVLLYEGLNRVEKSFKGAFLLAVIFFIWLHVSFQGGSGNQSLETNERRRKKRVKLNDDVCIWPGIIYLLFITYYCFDETAAGYQCMHIYT